MAQPVPGVGVGVVGLVLHPALAAAGAEAFRLPAGQAQQRVAETLPLWPDARRAVEPGAPRQPEQQRFRLVSSSMGGSNGGYPFGVQGVKTGAAQFPGPVLPGAGRHGKAHVRRVKHPQRHAQPPALPPDEGFVPVGGRAPQPVVHMARRQLITELRLQFQQNAQQRHAVGPAGDGGAELLPRIKQLVFLRKGAHFFQNLFHQRLKSTSMKRVCAPSQPSGTVLVSPWRFFATMHSAVSASTSAPSGFWLA